MPDLDPTTLTGLTIRRAIPDPGQPWGPPIDLPDLPLESTPLDGWIERIRQGRPAPSLRPVTTVSRTETVNVQQAMERAIGRFDPLGFLETAGPEWSASSRLLDMALALQPAEGSDGSHPAQDAERFAAQETIVALLLARTCPTSPESWRLALTSGNPRLLYRLLAAGHRPNPSPQTQDLSESSWLLDLAKNPWSSAVLLVDPVLALGVPVDSPNPDLTSALHLACEQRRTDLVQRLLDRGANPNRPRPDGAPPLKTAFTAPSTDLVMLLLHAGADLHAPIPAKGRTVLEDAVVRGALPALQRLLDEGIDPFQSPRDLPPEQAERFSALGMERLHHQHRLNLLRNGLVNLPTGQTEAAQACLVLLETHWLSHAMDDGSLSAKAPRSPRRRL